MEIEGESIDRILFQLYSALLNYGKKHASGTRGETLELIGVSLRLLRPRARLSRSENRGKPFSAIGELLWYLSGSDRLEFIEPYVGEYVNDAVDGSIHGAYGPRLTSMRGRINQIDNIVKLLSRKPGSRRAVIQLFNAEDIENDYKEIPCTTTIQFHLRDKLLHMSTTLRSNDAYWGLPHDVFCFTMLQEILAIRLNVELGHYYQYVGSMHAYVKHLQSIRAYIDEGVHQTAQMPSMPSTDPFQAVSQLLDIEHELRVGSTPQDAIDRLDPYWADITRLLQVFWARTWSTNYRECLTELQGQLTADVYRPYVDGRMHLGPSRPQDQSASN